MDNMKIIIYIISFLLLFLLNIYVVLPESVKGICGIPSVPYNARLIPRKENYSEGEVVVCKCENFRINFKQSRMCVKGKWTGPQPICGENTFLSFF